MRWIALTIVAGVLGCGGSTRPEPAAPAETIEIGKPACASYALYGMKMVSAGEHRTDHPAFGVAAAAADKGQAAFDAGDGKAAGRHFLDCARAYREVADDHFQRDTARENAEHCYKNAYHSFGQASAFKSEGRALFEAARAEDPRMAPLLDELLAGDPDCP